MVPAHLHRLRSAKHGELMFHSIWMEVPGLAFPIGCRSQTRPSGLGGWQFVLVLSEARRRIYRREEIQREPPGLHVYAGHRHRIHIVGEPARRTVAKWKSFCSGTECECWCWHLVEHWSRHGNFSGLWMRARLKVALHLILTREGWISLKYWDIVMSHTSNEEWNNLPALWLPITTIQGISMSAWALQRYKCDPRIRIDKCVAYPSECSCFSRWSKCFVCAGFMLDDDRGVGAWTLKTQSSTLMVVLLKGGR